MTVARRNPDRSDAVLTLPGKGEIHVANESELRIALNGLSLMGPGETVSLARSPTNYVRASRRGDFWAAVTRRGGWWTLASFTAEMTTEYSERQVRQSRGAGSIRKRIALAIASPRSEQALSTLQVETIFIEYFLGRRFSIPRSGAQAG